ncbi:Nucleoside triphosphatase NudI [Candidatus Nanosynsacchari sp. TM7_G1_3_12Alb]|nr:Nucleoside triphosphatase NudI [Candidatus Nanosynsacchari sp. TM7_G1_3_12Alb]
MTKTIIYKDVFGNQYTVPVDELNIRVGVYAVIIEDNKILLTRQWDGYSLIGGGVEKGETIEESIAREVKEETGLTIMPDKIIHQATTFFKRNTETQADQSIQLYFTHSQLHGQINNDNITDSEKTYTNGTPEWVDLDKIDVMNFRHSVSLRAILGAYRESTNGK